MVEGEAYEDVKDIASKAVSQIAKLALVLHLAENPAVLDQLESEISGDAGCRPSTRGVVPKRSRPSTTDGGRGYLARTCPSRSQAGFSGGIDSVTSMKLTQSGPRPRLKATEADKVLDSLAEHGYLRSEKQDGKKKPIFWVNPALFSHFSQFSQG